MYRLLLLLALCGTLAGAKNCNLFNIDGRYGTNTTEDCNGFCYTYTQKGAGGKGLTVHMGGCSASTNPDYCKDSAPGETLSQFRVKDETEPRVLFCCDQDSCNLNLPLTFNAFSCKT